MAVASASTGPPCCPAVHQNTGCSVLKDEDVLVVEHQRPWPGSDAASSPLCRGLARGSSGDASDAPSLARCSACGSAADQYSLFAVFDGHNGASAARLAAKEVVPVLEERLPQGAPPSPHSPQFTPWREDIQLALVETLAELNRMFALRGILAGCTATLVLQVGWLVTAANLGDSRAIIDTGVESHHLTVDHRVATHKGERRRVEAMGNTIAPIDFSGSGPATRVDNGVGPLRIWPGGLCLSRAIGDFDVGDSVIPFPHVMQVMVPTTGARLLIASDGVWDAYEKMGRVGAMLRSWSLDVCPQRLIQSIVRAYGGLRDDTSLVVVDILPPGKTFPECAASTAAAAKAAGGGSSHGGGGSGHGGTGAMCGCFGSAPSAPPAPIAVAAAAEEAAEAAVPAAVGRLEVLADLDVAAVMGLMPETETTTPGWYDEYVGEALFSLASEAMELWHEAHERRTGRRPATPQLDSSVRAARAARALLEGDVQPLIDSSDAAWAPAPAGSGLGGGMRRNASMFFPQAIADGDYADKFGHYKGATPGSLASGSPGSSLHGPGDSEHGGTGSPGGSGHRAGGYKYNDASVRAGNRYNDGSVRAGSRYLGGVGDISVRAGSRYGGEAPVRGAGDVSVRAGSSFYGGSGSGSGGGGQQGPAAPPFRPDPSIRSGTAALRYLSDSAGSAGSGDLAPLAAAASADEGGEGRRHGVRSAALAAALSANRGGGGSGTAPASAPIPVPRNVTFGAEVKVMGAAPPAAPAGIDGDSPMERSAALQPAPGSATAVGHMDSIAEA